MSKDHHSSLTVEEAQKLLKNYTCINIVQSEEEAGEKATIEEALRLVVKSSDYQMLGVCASSQTEGFIALQNYLKGLGYEEVIDVNSVAPIEGSVYIKFNTMKKSYYIDSYIGTYRGVLVSCQCGFEDGVNETYGHFPLDLFKPI